MLRTLNSRLILSHILPLLLIVPLMSVALIYVLETQLLIPNLSREMAGDGYLVSQIVQDHPDVWKDPQTAQIILNRVSSSLNARIILLDTDGRLLASNDQNDAVRINNLLDIPNLAVARNGNIATSTFFSSYFNSNVVEVLTPVFSSNHQVVGMVQASIQYKTVFEELIGARAIIAGILVVGLLSGAGLATILAQSIGTPIRRIAEVIQSLAYGTESEPLPENGPEEIKLLVRAVNLLEGRLHNLEQTRRQLLANLIHEIGRPLGAIRPAIKALIKGANRDPKLYADLLQGMDEKAAVLQRLLDDLASLHQQVLGTLELDRQPVALNEWLPKTLRPWEEPANEKNLRWIVTFPPDLPTVNVDPVRLAQVIGNLVSNSIKFTPMGGTVSISAGTEGKEFWVQVADTGPGIPLDEQDKIFTPFFRGRQNRHELEGMGLGLPIVHDLVVAHGGKIEVKSTPDHGSCFTFWIPRNIPASGKET